MRLAGKSALITGAASGIGRETAQRFAEEGAAVVCVDLDGAGAARVAHAIGGKGGTALSVPADLTDADEVRGMADEALSARGAIDILVNNAGVSILGGVAELTEAAWQREIDTNLGACAAERFWAPSDTIR